MTDLERALADIAEVRERLGSVQRFKGYSGLAAMISGALAIATGIVQLLVLPHVRSAHDAHLYFALWFACCGAAMMLNYSAIAHWYVNDATARERWQTASVGFSILPAIVVGGALSFALLRENVPALLPGVWCACYGTGLFASRGTLPQPAVWIAAAFAACGIALLFAPAGIALSWWVLAVVFGVGQIAIGAAVVRV
ncbi:MAG: hypothetical protein ABR508_10775 [Candidatus Baltobacteraceae bacterium]